MAVIAIGAVGFTMQFGIANLINLAYGDIMAASAFVAYGINHTGASVWLGLPASVAFGAGISFLLNRALYAPFQRRGASHLGMVIVALAATLIISNVLLAIVGPDDVSYQMSGGPVIRLGDVVLTSVQVAIIAIALGIMFAVHLLLTSTRLGQAMRAT